MTKPLMDASELHVWLDTPHGVVRAVDDVDLKLFPGRTLGLVGESGSGKSVLARTLLGLNPQRELARYSGRIELDGHDLLGLGESQWRALRGRELSMVFQDPMTSLNPVMTVGRQISGVLRYRYGLGRRAARAEAEARLAEVGIPSPAQRARQYPHQLSGGMRQRAMIALAIACRPRVLIADEPTTALDVTVQAQIMDLIMHLRENFDMAVLLISHDLALVAEVADDIAVMYAGRIVEYAKAEKVLRNPRMPYTRGLLDCLPRIDRGGDQAFVTIPGRPPSLIEPPPGCLFAPRCHRAQARCRRVRPELEGREHRFACHYPLAEDDA